MIIHLADPVLWTYFSCVYEMNNQLSKCQPVQTCIRVRKMTQLLIQLMILNKKEIKWFILVSLATQLVTQSFYNMTNIEPILGIQNNVVLNCIHFPHHYLNHRSWW